MATQVISQKTKYQLIVDQSAQGSLALIQQLEATADSLSHNGDGEYEVEGNADMISYVVARHDDAVLKFEEV